MAKITVIDPLDEAARKLPTELKPNSKPQESFLSLPDEIFEAGYGGTAGTGKTFALVTLPLFRRCQDIRGFYGKIWRRSYPQIQESLEPESQKWYPRFGFTYNAQEHEWTHPRTRAKIAFGFIDKDKDALKHDSAQYHYLGFEECTQFTRFVYVYLTHRCRSDISGWSAICRNVATPGDIGNTWYRKYFIEPAPNGYRVIEGIFKSKVVKRMFIRAHKGDNVDLERQDPGYYDRLNMLPEALRKAKLFGDFWAFQGQVFEEFRTFHIDGEPDNAVHVIEPEECIARYGWRRVGGEIIPPEWWPKIIAIDWGFRHGNYVVWGAVSPKGEFIIYREYLAHFTPIKVWASNAKRMCQYDGNIVKVVCDPSAFWERGEEKTLAEQIANATDWTIEKANNDRVAGKQLIHEILRWQGRPKKFDTKEGFDQDYAQRLLRLKGLAAYTVYVNQFVPDLTEELLPKGKILSSCPAVIESIQACIYDEGEGNNRQRSEDVKKQDGDDPYDGYRYACKEYEAFTEGVNHEWTKRCEMDKALSEFQTTGDYNTFDNRMSIIEEKYDLKTIAHSYPKIRRHTRAFIH